MVRRNAQKKAVAGIVMGSLDHPPGVSVNLKLVRDKMDKDTFQCGKKSLNYQTSASYLQIAKKEDELDPPGCWPATSRTSFTLATPSYATPPHPTIPTLPLLFSVISPLLSLL